MNKVIMNCIIIKGNMYDKYETCINAVAGIYQHIVLFFHTDSRPVRTCEVGDKERLDENA